VQLVVNPVPPTEWTFIVYMDGDNSLEASGLDDFNEMEAAPSNPAARIVVQFDRISGLASTDPDWTTTRRYLVTHDDDTSTIHSTMIQDMGELDMGDPSTLVSFVDWAIQNYPAKHYALVLWDHGGGWRSENSAEKGVCVDDTPTLGSDILTMAELRSALNQISIDTGRKLDIVGFDACLMGMLEVDYQIKEYADYRVGSEENEPGDGWNYLGTLTWLASHTTTSALDFAKQIVADYSVKYGTNGNAQTLSAVSLGMIGNVKSAVNNLAQLLTLNWDTESYKAAIKDCRSGTQQFGGDPEFVDLYDFAWRINNNPALPQNTRDAANTLIIALAVNNYVATEMHGSGRPGSHGVSIYFPSSTQSYETTYDNLLFAQDTKWDEFLKKARELGAFATQFDFGTSTSPVESGYVQVTESTVYASGYGWDGTVGLGSRDRGGPNNLQRDLVFSGTDHTFNVDLANGQYKVTLTIGDNSYTHDLIDVYAENVLQVNHLTVSAGTFSGRVFIVTVGDGQLNIRFHDAGGSDPNWVINAIKIEPFVPIAQLFDFGTGSSPVESGYVQVTESTAYSAVSGFGWDGTAGLGSRDRGAPDNLQRDLVFSGTDHTFNVDLANGQYKVTLTIGDNSYTHDLIDVYAEGVLQVNHLTVNAGTFSTQVFTVTVADGQLSIRFHDAGGSDANWVINAIKIEQAPTTTRFDFGTVSSPLESGYASVTESSLYSAAVGYGWDSSVGLNSRDRGSPDNLRRDFVFSSSDHTFSVDLSNGVYNVTLIVGDLSFDHNKIDVYAEGVLKVNDLTVPKGTFTVVSFTVTVSDGQLNIGFHDDGGVDPNWVINAMTIENMS
jgi:fibronectin type 3 domain-containing protein